MSHRDTDEVRHLTEADIERIAEIAAERALEKVYGQIGKSLVTRVLWLAGALALGWATAKGWFKAP